MLGDTYGFGRGKGVMKLHTPSWLVATILLKKGLVILC